MIKLGLIGISKGNGHPYSWAAIINDYDRSLMLDCGFPVIPKYLGKQKFPEASIQTMAVTHIWTQDFFTSKKIAKTTFIPNLVSNYKDMIGQVDGILLARDDAENHQEIAKPFLEAGIPIFIDKPLAYSVEEAKNIFSLQHRPNQIFSCSAFKYALEVEKSKSKLKKLGKIKLIRTTVPKDWKKYSVHGIDPVISLFPNLHNIAKSIVWKSEDRVTLLVEFSNGIELQIQSAGNCMIPVTINICGEYGYENIIIKDTFAAFKRSLKKFEECIINKKSDTKDEELMNIIKIIELGIN